MPTTYEGVGDNGHYNFAFRIFSKLKSWIDAQGFMTNNGLVDKIYPVGSIYMSVNNVNPSTIFGGTWETWGSGQVPVGVNTNDTDFNTVEKTGGAKSENYTPAGSNSGGAVQSHTLTAAESGIPKHGHGMTQATYKTTSSGTCTATGGNHRHAIAANAKGGAQISGTNYLGVYNDAIGASSYVLTQTTTDATLGRTGASGSLSLTVPNHTHTVTINSNASVTDKAAANATSGHTHGLTQPTFSGTQATINHLQPYITCYMWKRVA